MISVDEEALICDLAETYQIYDYRRLPLQTVAVFSVGLREGSRIKMKLSGAKAPAEIVLMASMVDRLSFLAWAKTKDAQKGRNKPKSLLSLLNPSEKNNQVYSSGEEYEQARNKLIGKEAE